MDYAMPIQRYLFFLKNNGAAAFSNLDIHVSFLYTKLKTLDECFVLPSHLRVDVAANQGRRQKPLLSTVALKVGLKSTERGVWSYTCAQSTITQGQIY